MRRHWQVVRAGDGGDIQIAGDPADAAEIRLDVIRAAALDVLRKLV
jgi:hypothetical protein